MIINGVTIDATFAEAFPMKATRAILFLVRMAAKFISAGTAAEFSTSIAYARMERNARSGPTFSAVRLWRPFRPMACWPIRISSTKGTK